MEFNEVTDIANTASSVTLSAKISRLYRGVASQSAVTALNNYNSLDGACGKTNWTITNFNVDQFVNGCGVVVNEDGMDDYKFSGQSLDDVIYWRVTYVDANNISVETSTDNITFDSPDTYKK